MRNFVSRQERQAYVAALSALGLQSAVWADPGATGLAAYSSLLTSGFFILLATFVGLVIWEVLDGKKSSRSSLDIAKLAAAAAKKQSSAGAPSGSLASMQAPATNRPFAPPPPPPPPPLAPPAAEARETSSPSPFASAGASAGNDQAFAPAPSNMMGDSPSSLESTVAFSPSGADAGSSGGWADLLQRVRAGEPESGGFPVPTPPPATEDEMFPDQTLAAQPPVSAASSSEAWEALLKRTTSGESLGASKPVAGDVGKISLSSNFGSAEPSPTSAFPAPAPMPSMFGEDKAAPLADEGPGSFSLPPAPPSMEPLGVGFSFKPEPSPAEASPFALPPAQPASGFEAPSFKLPGSDDSGGFQLPGGNSPFDFGASDGSSTSTLPLSDLFSSKSAPAAPPAFQLPGTAGADPFGGSEDAGVGRTISLDFSKGGGQKPPPPLPRTEG